MLNLEKCERFPVWKKNGRRDVQNRYRSRSNRANCAILGCSYNHRERESFEWNSVKYFDHKPLFKKIVVSLISIYLTSQYEKKKKKKKKKKEEEEEKKESSLDSIMSRANNCQRVNRFREG